MDLASMNAHLQQRIAELEALAEAAEAAAQAQHQQRDEVSPEPSTPQHQRMRATCICDEGASMQERATSVLKRAAAASRLSGMFEVREYVRCCPLLEYVHAMQLSKVALVTRRFCSCSGHEGQCIDSVPSCACVVCSCVGRH
jgi:hypothetical protein